MPRAAKVAIRRKASPATNNNEEGPMKKIQRTLFSLPLPKINSITGKVLACGQGDMGQLGLGDDEKDMERKRPALVPNLTDIVDVRAGGMHNLCLDKNGQVYSFGCNDEGALGRDSSEEGSEFTPKKVDLPGKCLKISAGDSHSACLLDDGKVYAWGSFRDSHGNMGLTLEGNKRLPIEVKPGIVACDIASGADHLVILTCNGKVYTVGCAEQGQLGRVSIRSASGESRRGKTELLQPGLVTIKKGKHIEAIWAATYCTFLRESGSSIIWAFGLNNYKQLGYPKDESVIINPINTRFEDVKIIAGGQHHTLVLKNDGSCYAIGRKDYGRLGLGNTPEDVTELKLIEALKDKEIVNISRGEAQSFAITKDGQLYAWGMGSSLQLGTGEEDDALVPTLIESKQTKDKKILQAYGGGQHSIFLVADDSPAAEVKEAPKKTQVAKVAETKDKKPTTTAATVVEEKKETELLTNGDANVDVPEVKETTTTIQETAAAPAAKKGRKKK
ncbi:regulator of chromosome condensation [Episyrphus balteatus]|uniref:regulator of chromosome condensation n=1 Tax=Episyrphus balteatus TaxID=286459 RepID=UPI002485DAC1|nr:regulator of chromosome condensation [Episyrphus balteatus]